MTIYLSLDYEDLVKNYNDAILDLNAVTAEKLKWEGDYEMLHRAYGNLLTEMKEATANCIKTEHHAIDSEQKYNELKKDYDLLQKDQQKSINRCIAETKSQDYKLTKELLAEWELQRKELQSELDKVTKNLRIANEHAEVMNQRIHDLEQEYDTVKCYQILLNNYQNTKEENNELNKKYETLLNDYTHTRSFNNALVRELREDYNELNKKYQTLLNDCESVKCNSLTEENEKLKTQLTHMNEIDARAQSLLHKNHELKHELERIEKVYKNKETEVNESAKRAITAETNYKELLT